MKTNDENKKFRTDMRNIVLEKPLQHITENKFINEYRFNNKALEDFCDLLII